MELPLNRMVYNGSVFINTGKKRAFATHFFFTFSLCISQIVGTAYKQNGIDCLCACVCVCERARFEVMRIKEYTVNILMFFFFSARFFIYSIDL